MSTATTATFREYTDESGAFVILNTDYDQFCRLSAVTDVAVRTAHLSRDTARLLGTSLIAWSGSPLSCTLEPVRFGSAAPPGINFADVLVEVLDGEATITLGGLGFAFEDDDLIDLAQRLIVWAGVAR